MPEARLREPLTRIPGARPLPHRPEADWRTEQLAEVTAAFVRWRVAAAAERDARQSTPGAERRRLREALGVEARRARGGRLRRDRVVSDRTVVIERWRVHDGGELVAAGLRMALVGAPAATTVIVVPGPDRRADLAALADAWLGPLIARGVAVVVLARTDRTADDPVCRRAAGKDRRHVLHRLGFGVGRTPEGLEVESIDRLVRAIRARGGGRRHAVGLLGVAGGARLAVLAGTLVHGIDAVAIDAATPPDLDVAGSPIDERLRDSARLPTGAGLARLVPCGLVSTDELADALGVAATHEPRGDLGPLPADWTGDEAKAVFRANERRLRRAIAEAAEAAYDQLRAPTPVGDRAPVAAGRRRRLEILVSGHDRQRRRPRRPTVAARLLRITDRFVAHEVTLDLGDGLTVWGHLLRPRGATRPGPAVICQHGLDGVPGDVTGLTAAPHLAYHAFGARLADSGYTVFAPYLAVPAPQAELLADAVEAALAVGAMRTQVEGRRLAGVIDFLGSLPTVDGAHIGYYGLSYGGYTAIWLGPLEERLAAVVVSGHFNDWSAKLTDDTTDASFLRHPDEDFTTWRGLEIATHPALVAAMWPRPVLVEWADLDDTTNATWHERAWADVAAWADAWDVADRVERVAFGGIHEIGGLEAFAFLDRWLRPERSSGRDYAYELRGLGRDLDGISDHAPETTPYVTATIDAEHAVHETVHIGTDDPRLRGVAVRVSRIGEPGDLEIRLGTTPGGAELATARIEAATIHPLWDLWHEARFDEVRLEPGRRYHLTIATDRGTTPRDGFTAYGPRPLGGSRDRDAFGIAYRLMGADESPPAREPTHEFGRRLLDSPVLPDLRTLDVRPARPDEVTIDATWSIDGDDVPRGVIVDGLRQSFGIDLDHSNAASAIALGIGPGARRTVARDAIRIAAPTPRALRRESRRLIDELRERGRPSLAIGTTVGGTTRSPRITTPAMPAGVRYSEASHPSTYTDGLLERIADDGFDAVWTWVNLEEIAHDSAVFPELDEPLGPLRLERLEATAQRAARHSVDVYVYLACGYDHPVPEWFYRAHPELRGHGFFGHPMCTSDPRVLAYRAEIVRDLVRRAPSIAGVIVNFDVEGYYYCGNDDTFRRRCPRCRHRSQEDLSREVLAGLHDAIRVDDPTKRLVIWSYGHDIDWIERLLPSLPADIALQVDLSKGLPIEIDGVRHVTGDYNLTVLGRPATFDRLRVAAAATGRPFIVKTEHAVSQEAIFVPSIPAMDRWAARAALLRGVGGDGFFANWDHYGYHDSIPARILTEATEEPAPSSDELLDRLARRTYGERARPHIRTAWAACSDAIAAFPYSDSVARSPGPLQKGVSHPLWLDPAPAVAGHWRAWQNDLAWTEPWGPAIAGQALTRVRDGFRAGAVAFAAARDAAEAPYVEAVTAEWRVARTIEASLTTVLHLLAWVPVRDAFAAAAAGSRERQRLGRRLRAIALAERANAVALLPLLDADSRLGFASDGGGIVRGGLFTPELVRWKIGQLDDLLLRELPEALRAQPG